jgi:hypothetical protein
MGCTSVVSHFITCINPLFLKLIVTIVGLGLIPFHESMGACLVLLVSGQFFFGIK